MMDDQTGAAFGARASDFVGRQPPSDGETVWIDDAYLFDLMVALCDVMYEDDCRRTSFQLERAIDEFLYEMGYASAPSRLGRKRREDFAKTSPDSEVTRAKPTRSTFEKTAVPKSAPEQRILLASRRNSKSPAAQPDLEKLIENICTEDGASTSRRRQTCQRMSKKHDGEPLAPEPMPGLFCAHPYQVTVTPADPKVMRLSRSVRRILRERRPMSHVKERSSP